MEKKPPREEGITMEVSVPTRSEAELRRLLLELGELYHDAAEEYNQTRSFDVERKMGRLAERIFECADELVQVLGKEVGPAERAKIFDWIREQRKSK